MYTKGPWIYREDLAGCPYVSAKNTDMVADINMVKTNNAFVSGREAKANARLIAAAPDMYEALRDCEKIICEVPASDRIPGWGIMLDKIQAAIAKAEGK